jgi:shikimate kinase
MNQKQHRREHLGRQHHNALLRAALLRIIRGVYRFALNANAAIACMDLDPVTGESSDEHNRSAMDAYADGQGPAASVTDPHR